MESSPKAVPIVGEREQTLALADIREARNPPVAAAANSTSRGRIRQRQFEQGLPQHLALGIGPERITKHAA